MRQLYTSARCLVAKKTYGVDLEGGSMATVLFLQPAMLLCTTSFSLVPHEGKVREASGCFRATAVKEFSWISCPLRAITWVTIS